MYEVLVVYTIIVVIRLFTIYALIRGSRFVYKKTKLSNKFMIAMFLFLNLAIILSTVVIFAFIFRWNLPIENDVIN